MNGHKCKVLRRAANRAWRIERQKNPRSPHARDGYARCANGEIRCTGERALYKAAKRAARQGIVFTAHQPRPSDVKEITR